MGSRGSVDGDGQRDDRLERCRSVQRVDHRREVLRAIRCADADSNTMHGEMYANAAAAPYTGAAPITKAAASCAFTFCKPAVSASIYFC
jgi:hypothetical protein